MSCKWKVMLEDVRVFRSLTNIKGVVVGTQLSLPVILAYVTYDSLRCSS